MSADQRSLADDPGTSLTGSPRFRDKVATKSSIISLSKLKDYMPQNQVNSNLFPFNPIPAAYYHHHHQPSTSCGVSSSDYLANRLSFANPERASSPTSVKSTPSPRTTNMHLSSVAPQIEHIHASGLADQTNSQAQLGHLGHHYMSSAANSVGLGAHQTQQHPTSHHYCAYNQAATGGDGSQHHLVMSAHDQLYAQHQQQQQQQHQQQQLQQQHRQLQQHHHHQQLQASQQNSMVGQQSIYHHLANNGVGTAVGATHVYGNGVSAGSHYQSHLSGNGLSGHQSSHSMSEAHQTQLNSAAAACAAAAAVSQTLKSVTNQPNHYGNSMTNGFGNSADGLMGISNQHHQQMHNSSALSEHHFMNQSADSQGTPAHHQQHQQSLSMSHVTTMATRKYQCKMCPQVFMSKAEMKYHNQNHMREAKPYKCLQCPKAFANSSYLSQHMRIHQGVKPYTCDICARKFTQLSHLQQHKRTHTGDKPYKCNYLNCTKQFSQLSNLQSHSRCHQLDKPYKCNSCYKCFHDESSLLEHIPRHLESKHLKKNLCIFCGSSYQQERGLVKHFQQYHTDKSPALVAAAIAAGTTGNTNLIASLVAEISRPS